MMNLELYKNNTNMKNQLFVIFVTVMTIVCSGSQNLLAQAPQKLSYQAVVFNSQNALVRNTAIGMRISILQASATGNIVFQETYSPNPQTNDNGVVSVEIGTGSASVGVFSEINWASGPYFIKSETDILGGTNYTISGVSQILSTPYALYADVAGNGFSGDYNDLTNQPIVDGSETKLVAGDNVSVSGTGTENNPYIINSSGSLASAGSKIVITTSQLFTIPQGVSKIKVELWGGAGGGGGAGAYTYSYYLNNGGAGGAGGYASQDIDVQTGQQFTVTIGEGGNAGVNAVYSGGNYYGDTQGGNGNDSFFGDIKAAAGYGGKNGSYAYSTVNGNPGTANIGTFTASAAYGGSNKLEVFYGYERSYLAERLTTSAPGTGGSISSYSGTVPPTSGEAGSAVITFY
jgi:hypothetical protein